ncbi:hypothetical protein BCR44DRAFT_51758 [Catenaria anguillulae PL171]|uniref:ODAD1 central coiled coil region domain-containing protein n=1 Tax=Catenaria anguillulae PL171 TaxID=765915 RepID=A0A1Y2H6U5_9FUNG|nr:hypothetical protein BCR44DRAFT_51758 [Catenaria anguillulae PL171]
MFDKQALLEQDLHDLKLRYELLEGDRKAYYEQSQLTISANKDEIAKLRTQNKELRLALGKVKKTNGLDKNIDRVHMTELEKLDQRVNELHKKADEMMAIARAKEVALQALRDKLRDLQAESALVREVAEKSEQAAMMRRLENQLDKAEIKWHEAQAIRKVYEEILALLHEERQSFDAQLAHFERTLRAKRADAAELELMSRDAHHARDLARGELARIEAQIAEDRKRRDKDLVARRELVRHKLEASEKLEQALLASTLANDSTARSGESEVNASVAEADALAERVAEYEELIKHIKEATGVDDLRQVVAKFEEQRDTRERLSELARTNETKLNAAKASRTDALTSLDEALVLGEHKGAAAKAAARELESQLQLEQNKLRDVAERHERMVKMLASVKSGIVHLWDKVKEDRSQKTECKDQDIGSVLEMCMTKIMSLLQAINGKDIAIEGDLSAIPVHLTTQNTRVRLLPSAFESEDDDSDNGGTGGNGVGEAGDDEGHTTVVPDRDAIKKATMAMLNARNKGKGGRKKKKKGGADDEDEDVSD